MANSTRKRFSFRLVNISKKQVDALKKICKAAKISYPEDRIIKRFRKNGIVASVPLLTNHDYSWISNYVRKNKITIKKCDVFVSIATGYDSRIISVPKYVMDVIHDLDVDVTFSFTSIKP